MRRSIICGLLVGAAALGGAASAQTGCQERLRQAQSLYISGAFDEVEAALEPCVQPGRMSPSDRVRAYRLLALSALQQGRLIEAKLVALSLLSVQPDYEPDPDLDPPAYADLIRTVRSQLAVTQAPPPTADTTRLRPQPVRPGPIPRIVDRRPGPIQVEGRPGQVYLTSPPLPYVPVSVGSPDLGYRPRALELAYWTGVAAFTGDFYRELDIDEYLTSDGPRLGFQAAYAPVPWVALGVSAEGHFHPRFPAQRRVGTQPGIRTEAVVASATLDARLRAASRSRVSPYLNVGASVVAARLLEETRMGVGPVLGLGLDVAVNRELSVFTEVTSMFPLPEDALDGSSRQHGDVFTGFRVGLRTRIVR